MNFAAELLHLPGFYEPFNAISHLVAAVVFALLGWKLVLRGRGNRIRLLFLSIYAFSCVFLLSMSAVFHMLVRGGPASQVLERIDHAAIFVLIAGTFTGIHGTTFRGWLLWVPMLFVWLATATCITIKTVYFETLPEPIGLSFYLGMGWGVALTAVPILRRRGFAYLLPLVYGGLAYSIGAFMEYMGWVVLIPGVIHAHEIWHIMVFAGALWQWAFVLKVVDDDVAERQALPSE